MELVMQFAQRGGSNSAHRTDTFTGTVYGQPVLSTEELAVSDVLFLPGGRTYWHSHGGGQVLTVKSGRGLVADRAGNARFIEPADVIHAHSGEEHWHGASPGSFMIHTSVAIGRTTWLEEVDEATYRKACDSAEQG
jgi:quercetin dioxygenase-like cupin family protein